MSIREHVHSCSDALDEAETPGQLVEDRRVQHASCDVATSEQKLRERGYIHRMAFFKPSNISPHQEPRRLLLPSKQRIRTFQSFTFPAPSHASPLPSLCAQPLPSSFPPPTAASFLLPGDQVLDALWRDRRFNRGALAAKLAITRTAHERDRHKRTSPSSERVPLPRMSIASTRGLSWESRGRDPTTASEGSNVPQCPCQDQVTTAPSPRPPSPAFHPSALCS